MNPSPGREMSGPVRVISDLHFGHRSSKVRDVAMLRPLLEGVGKVIFNGDTCEQLYEGWRARGEEMFKELVALCEGMGVEAVFVRGNHDPQISEIGWVTACGGKVMITHGDLVLDNPSPWSRECLLRKKEVAEILSSRAEGDGSLHYRWQTLQLINQVVLPTELKKKTLFSGTVFNAVWPPERLYHILRVWLGIGRYAEKFVEQFVPECRVLIFGHFHRATVIERNGRLFCNTGAYFPMSQARVVDLSEDEIVVREVVEQGSEFQLGREVKRRSLAER